jgi:hypothetical protein
MISDLESCDLLLKLYNNELLGFIETLDAVYYYRFQHRSCERVRDAETGRGIDNRPNAHGPVRCRIPAIFE